jgi:Tol biopolymer transport system component
MTTPERIERGLPSILADLAMGPTPEYLDDVLVQTARMRQRPRWTFPERWLPMADIPRERAIAPHLPWRTIAVALVILALLVAAAIAYVGTHQTRLPAPFGPAANGLIPYVSSGDLYVGDPATGTTRLLVGGPEDVAVPQFSPDGTHVVFLQRAHAAGPDPVDVYVVGLDGSDVKRITPESLPDWTWLSWTPDGRQLAMIHPVESTGGGCPTTICHANQLDLFDATGSGAVQHLASAEGMDFVQYRPPQGGEILYRALVDGKWGLFAMDADGSNAHTLAAPTVPAGIDLSFGGATYTPDGSRIFYQHGDDDGCCRLWVMNADGTDDHEFLPRGAAWDGQAVPSPDGTRIAYWHNGNDLSEHGVSVVRADGTGPVIDTGPTVHGLAHWVWAPDSSRILMFADDSSSTSAYLLDPDGGPATTVPWRSDGDLDWQRKAP